MFPQNTGYWLNRRPGWWPALHAQMDPDTAELPERWVWGHVATFNQGRRQRLWRNLCGRSVFWLTAGADGLATLTENSTAHKNQHKLARRRQNKKDTTMKRTQRKLGANLAEAELRGVAWMT